MKKYAKNIEDRKVLVTRLSDLTGLKPHYTRVPRCAYEIGAFTVEKDGALVAEDNADQNIIETLLFEKLVKVIEEHEEESANEVQTETASTEDEDEELEDMEEPLEATIAFPLYQHTSTSLVNLVNMIYSRGLLLSKATGGEFYVSKELTDALLEHPTFIETEEVVDFLRNIDGQEQRLVGLSFNDEQVIFDGFGAVRDAGHLQTFMKLAAAMNKMAITQKRVQAKEVSSDNEKYALRVWLIRLGMNGAEYKEDRKRLMINLTGHSAFRNEADRTRWTARQTVKRETIRASKTAAQPAENNV